MDLKRGDLVKFSLNGIKGKGTIEVIDRFGGGIYDGKYPTVDIMGDDGIFYKHVPIHEVERIMDRSVKNVVTTMAVEDMYLSKDFIKELEKVAKGEKTSEELRQEVIKKYAK